MAEAKTVRYAISVGFNDAPTDAVQARLEGLAYADDDAVRYHDLFQRMGARTTLLTVLDVATQRRYPELASTALSPTLQKLRQTVRMYTEYMQSDLKRGDEPVFYLSFSGHGAHGSNGEPFLALASGRLTQAVLYEEVLAALPAKYSHLFVDACHAGSVVGVRRAPDFENSRDTRASRVDRKSANGWLTPLERHPNVGVLVATTAGQEAHEWSEIEAGVFSYEIISGLLGAADVNADRRVEYSELQAFVASANRSLKDPRAAPRVIARPPAVDHHVPLVLLDELQGPFLVGDAFDIGRLDIELENGLRYLSVHLGESWKVMLALPRGMNLFVRTEQTEAQVEAPKEGTIRFEDLEFRPKKVRGKGSLASAYHTGLFASAYGPTYYKGYVDREGGLGVAFASSGLKAVPAQRRDDHRGWAMGLGAAALASAAASVTTAVLAVKAKDDFNDTTLQRSARDASARVGRFTAISVATGLFALGTGVSAWLLWPEASHPSLLVDVAPDGIGASAGWAW